MPVSSNVSRHKFPMADIRSSDEAKARTIEATSRRRSHEESLRFLEDLRGYLARAQEDDAIRAWQDQIHALEDWLASEQYKTGNFPMGIDDLVLEIIEWRAVQHAFQQVDIAPNTFSDSVFFQQWLIGSIYAIYSILGKLVGKAPGETSLRKLWWEVSKFVSRDGACPNTECKFIGEQLDRATGKFTNNNSLAMQFRNNVIAHNQRSIALSGDEIDSDIRIIVRIWSILVSWSSFGIIAPFRNSEHAFSGLDGIVTGEELVALKLKRQEYIDRVINWAQTHLHTGAVDLGGTPFTSAIVSSNIF